MDDEPVGSYQKHGHPAETIGLAAVAALGLEAILPGTGAPGWVLPTSEIIASSGTALVTWSFTGRKLFPGYMAALGAFLGGWTAFFGAAGPWSGSAIGSLLSGTAVLTPAGVWAWHKRKPKPAPEPPMITAAPEVLQIEPEPDENEVQRGLFATMFADYGLHAGIDQVTGEPRPLEVTALTEERWGRLVRVRLPLSGSLTIENFRDKARNFEVALQGQEGAVTFDTGLTSADVLMKIRERDGLAESAVLTAELRGHTVNEPFAIGVQEDGSYLKVTVRESHFMIIGIMGSGKSNLLNVLIAQLAGMTDTVIWMIDMKGGRAAKPWFQPWSEGRAGTPPIDWLATSRSEAELMMKALRAAVDTRSASGVGGNKIIPSPSRPQIVFVCDEMADLFGDSTAPTRTDLGEDPWLNTRFQKEGTWLTQHSRSEAVATVWASQRGTNGMSGSGDMKANIDVSIALKPKKASDLQYILEDVPNLAARQVSLLTRTPGVGMLARGPHNSQITKFLHHDHIEGVCGADERNPRCVPECPVYQSALESAPVRPRLDRMTAQALGTDYAQRWVRASQAGVLRVPQMALSGGSAMNGYGSGGSEGFEEILASGGFPDPEKDLHPGRVRMRELLAARKDGMSPKSIMDVLEQEGIAPVRETVQKWLAEDARNGLVHHPRYRCWKSGPGTVIEGE